MPEVNEQVDPSKFKKQLSFLSVDNISYFIQCFAITNFEEFLKLLNDQANTKVWWEDKKNKLEDKFPNKFPEQLSLIKFGITGLLNAVKREHIVQSLADPLIGQTLRNILEKRFNEALSKLEQ